MVVHPRFITPEDYLRKEIKSDIKHEYVDGVIVSMAGARPEHTIICTNLAEALGPLVRGSGCRGMISDIRIRLSDSNRYYYTDYTIVCGNPIYEDVSGVRSMVNPTIIFEVMSPTTEKRDRGEKWLAYKRLQSLRSYILVHQNRALMEVYTRVGDTDEWTNTDVAGKDARLALAFLGVQMNLDEIYRDIQF